MRSLLCGISLILTVSCAPAGAGLTPELALQAIRPTPERPAVPVWYVQGHASRSLRYNDPTFRLSDGSVWSAGRFGLMEDGNLVIIQIPTSRFSLAFSTSYSTVVQLVRGVPVFSEGLRTNATRWNRQHGLLMLADSSWWEVPGSSDRRTIGAWQLPHPVIINEDDGTIISLEGSEPVRVEGASAP